MAVQVNLNDLIPEVRRLIGDVGVEGDLFVNDNYTIPTKSEIFRLDVEGSATITMPACSADHPAIIIRKLDNAGVVSVQRVGSDTINGASVAIVLPRVFDVLALTPTSASNWSAISEPNQNESHANADLVFSDDIISDDLRREGVVVDQMWLVRNMEHEDTPSSTISDFWVYEAYIGGWALNSVLYDEDHTVVTADTEDLIAGRWGFDSDNKPSGRLYVRGSVHDLYACAANMLVRWANLIKLNYNTSNDKGSFSRLDRIPRMMELAKDYRDKSWVYNVRSVSPFPGSAFSPIDLWKRGW